MPAILNSGLMPRRRSLAAIATFVLLQYSSDLAAESSGQSFELVLPSQLMPGLRDAATYPKLMVEGDPKTIDPIRGLPLIYVAVGVLMMPEIAHTLMSVYRDYKYGGAVVESRNGTLQITHDPSLSADTMIVKDPTGKVTIHQNRAAADSTKWVEILTAATKK